MKKILAMLVVVALMVPVISMGAEKNTIITIEDFERRYNEANAYFEKVFMIPFQRTFPEISETTDGSDLIYFTIPLDGYSLRGNAYPDTGVISSLLIYAADDSSQDDATKMANGMKIMGVLYAISPYASFEKTLMSGQFEKDLSKLDPTNGKGGLFNNYKVDGELLNGIGGWQSVVSFVYDGAPPTAENVPNARDYFGYKLFYLEQMADYAKDLIGSTGGTVGLSSGEYVVGKHIAAGEYSVKAEKSAYIGVRRGERLTVNEALNKDNEIGRAVLQDGDNIEISGGKVIFTPLK